MTHPTDPIWPPTRQEIQAQEFIESINRKLRGAELKRENKRRRAAGLPSLPRELDFHCKATIRSKMVERTIRRIDHLLNQVIDYVDRFVMATPPDAAPAATGHLDQRALAETDPEWRVLALIVKAKLIRAAEAEQAKAAAAKQPVVKPKGKPKAVRKRPSRGSKGVDPSASPINRTRK